MPATPLAPETVVLVHGLWMGGWVMRLLARRLQRCGFQALRFSYPSVRAGVAENAAALADFIGKRNEPVVHLIGHSLGGLVILRALRDDPALARGRVLLLGSPVNGSATARWLCRNSLARRLLGASLADGLLDDRSGWTGARNMGVIAGTRPFGIGCRASGIEQPHDGTVAVVETRLPGAAACITAPVTHMGLVLGRSVARQACAFLSRGRFDA